MNNEQIAYTWKPYNKDSKPTKYGKYLVCRNGKVHFEIYNGTSFAYNDNTITFFAEVNLPK